MTSLVAFKPILGIALFGVTLLSTTMGCTSPDSHLARSKPQTPGAGVSPHVPPPTPQPTTPPQAFFPKRK